MHIIHYNGLGYIGRSSLSVSCIQFMLDEIQCAITPKIVLLEFIGQNGIILFYTETLT